MAGSEVKIFDSSTDCGHFENVRLVIWDLDETFWKGTLTEGGIEYIDTHHEIVIELARRGILSSICSKNDFETVKNVLVERGLWDYFVFPSINWESKGKRLSQLVKTLKLRAPTVLFIDDNALNRNEAEHFVAGLKVADEKIISTLLSLAVCKGKDDHTLSRLKQYKLLEQRHTEMCQLADNSAFLRASNITVEIENDVEAYLERAIELINRTNQLNFTKQRLSEDDATAKEQLIRQLRAPNTQAGLVRVKDKYGDYGIIGFYLLHVHTWTLVHFCFSCRTIGMGVEQWLYSRLKAPKLDIIGDVQVDLTEETAIDWINSKTETKLSNRNEDVGSVFIRGGCEMQAVAHYFALNTKRMVTEFPFDRRGLPIVINHSAFLAAAIEGITDKALATAYKLGYDKSDFVSDILSENKFNLFILSFWADGLYALYSDAEELVKLPLGVYGINNGSDVRYIDIGDFKHTADTAELHQTLNVLKTDFNYLSWSLKQPGNQGVSVYENNLRMILKSVPSNSHVFLLLGCEYVFNLNSEPSPVPHFKELNHLTRRLVTGLSNVHLIDPLEFVIENTDIIDATHFDRRLYFRIYERIMEIYRSKRSGSVSSY